MDSDGEGLNDNIELRGWLVTVRGLDGSTRQHEVTSDPGDPRLDVDDPANVLARDTDGEGLDDATEHLLATDPRRPDTDGDTLDDNEEFNVIFTDPATVDSDEDGIDDSLEVGFFKTNALEADSDGDGYDDGDELFARHRDPRLADQPPLREGARRGGNQHLEQTDTESSRADEEAFERSLAKGSELSATRGVTREVAGASAQVEVTLRNPGSVAISLSNVALTLRTTDPQDPSRLVPVATLIPETTLLTGEPAVFNIGPGETRGPILFGNTDIFPSMVEDLLRAPRGFVVQVANYDLVTGDDRTSRSACSREQGGDDAEARL